MVITKLNRYYNNNIIIVAYYTYMYVRILVHVGIRSYSDMTTMSEEQKDCSIHILGMLALPWRCKTSSTAAIISSSSNSAGNSRSKRLIIVHGFWPETENFDYGKKGYHRNGHHKGSRMAQILAP